MEENARLYFFPPNEYCVRTADRELHGAAIASLSISVSSSSLSIDSSPRISHGVAPSNYAKLGHDKRDCFELIQ